jgi:hypothetical protein
MNSSLIKIGRGAVLVGSFALSSSAWADEPPPEKKKRLIVTVEDTKPDDGEEPAKPKKKQVREAVPDESSSEAEINAYLRKLRRELRDAQADLKAAKRGDDGEEVLRLEGEVRELKETVKDEESRLTTKDGGLVAGGAVLTALGSVSLVSSLVLVFVWPLTALDGNINEEYGWGALGCFVGGAVGLAAGIPMIVTGNRRVPRGDGGDGEYEYLEEGLTVLPRVGVSPALGPDGAPGGAYVGLTVSGAF